MPYSPTTWVNNASPALSAENLNKIEQGIAAAVRYENLADFNAATTRGFYTISGSVANAPPTGGGYWALIVVPSTFSSGSYATQIAIKESTLEMYLRTCAGGTWKPWTRIITAEQFIISQSTPTVINGGVWIKY